MSVEGDDFVENAARAVEMSEWLRWKESNGAS